MNPTPHTLYSFMFLLTMGLATAIAADHGGIAREPRLQEQEEIVKSFAQLADFQAALAGAELTAYEGLPHQFIEADVTERELKAKDTVERYGFHFYQAPVAFPEGAVEWFRESLADPKSFRKFMGFKACGGFHPDWALVWTSGDVVTEFHICFGCGEIRAYQGDKELYCDMSPKGDKKLGKLLRDHRVQRPK